MKNFYTILALFLLSSGFLKAQIEVHNITDFVNGYDLQSNGSPQQFWIDPDGGLNAVFMTSQEDAGWADRTCTYFYSSDEGVTWIKVGDVPPSAPFGGVRSGFPSITGYSFGSVAIANHSNFGGGSLRTQLFINSAPGENDFANFSPDNTPSIDFLYPRIVATNNDLIFFGTTGGINMFNINTASFLGYSNGAHMTESYSFAVSASNKIGHAYLDEMGGVWFRQSMNNGFWSVPTKVFTAFTDTLNSSIMWSSFHGISMTYIEESPNIVFEIVQKNPDLTGFYPGLPSKICFWSPEKNGGEYLVIADSSNVPFYPNQGITDNFAPLCRPVIGKLKGDHGVVVAFSAASDKIAPTLDSTRFYSGYFTFSFDGSNWQHPYKFTPDYNPPLDFRYISIPPIIHIEWGWQQQIFHFVMQGDPVPGSSINGAPPGVVSKFYHINFPMIVGVDDKFIPYQFDLSQNYPNPFNPVTTIKYSIPAAGKVKLAVYDILGREVKTLLNNEDKTAGVHEVNFNASGLSSGVYFYRLSAGSFSQVRKMIVIK